MILDKKLLRKITKLADQVGGEVYRRYSGRCMFGAQCIGITARSLTDILVTIEGCKPSSDNMGLDFIAYWPSIVDDGTVTLDSSPRKVKGRNLEMEARAVTALKRTWQAIGYDCLCASAGYGKDGNPESVTLRRSDVIDHVTSCGYIGGHPESYGDDDEAIKWLDQQSEACKQRLLREAFPDKYYGA